MIAVVFALEFESACFRAKHDPRLRVAVWILGATGANAAQGLEKKLAKIRPSLVICAGFAGSLQSGLDTGNLVLGKNSSDPQVAGRLVLGERWHTGDVATEEAIVERAEDKRRLGAQTGCLATDLETAHMAEVCARHEVPMLSVRCISDTVEDDMPVPANILLNPKTGRPDSLLLLRHLIMNPNAVAGFNRLLKNARIAQRCLAEGLDEILPQLLQTS